MQAPDQWRRIKEIVAAAVERPPNERQAYVNQVCQGDDTIRTEVESLLSAYESSLGLSGSEWTNQLVEAARISKSIGPYRLIHKLGEGGMGQVWLAEQTAPVRRQVALKLLRAGIFDDSLLRRFNAEQQLLAIMDHPAIAKVFDAGTTPDGQPYFVMECVAGIAITNYCDLKKLTVRQRLDLFVRVCEGVQHAHQKAILHRDLKPSNILVVEVDGKPMPRIIDFGVAKPLTPYLSGETLHTRIGVFVGTPGYMSPEQADPRTRDMDTRADVYSLGVVFFQLLTGSLPFDVAQWKQQPPEDVLRHIRQDEPPPPSAKIGSDLDTLALRAKLRSTEPRQLVNALRGDLDWITMKALEKDRNRRYGTVSEFAADVTRHLNSEPVLARPARAVYRISKYIRRHHVAASVAVLIVLLLTGFSVVQAVQLRRITRERDRADREAAAAKNVSDFLVGLFRVSDPSEARGNSITAREILDQGRARIESNLTSQPELQARLMQTMGEVYESLGLYPKAQPLFQQVVEIRRRLLGPEHPDTLTSMDHVAENLERLGHYPEAESLARNALAIGRRALGPENELTVTAMHTLASITLSEGDYAEAEKLNRSALEIDDRIYGPEHPLTLTTKTFLARALSEQGKFPEAEKLLREALQAEQRIHGPEHARTLAVMYNLGIVLRMSGQSSEAEKLDRSTLEVRQRFLGQEHPETLASMSELAETLDDLHRYDEAEVLYRKSLAIDRRILGPDHPDSAMIEYNLACNLALRGRRSEALTVLGDAMDHGLPVRSALMIEGDSDFQSLRGDPRFTALVALAHERAHTLEKAR